MGWFKNLMIGKKFIVMFLVMILFIAAVGFLGIRSAREINEYVNDSVKVRMPAMDFLIQADRDLQQLLVAERSMIFEDSASEVFAALKQEYEENLDQSRDRWEQYKKLASSDEEKEIFPKYEGAREEWAKVSGQIVSLLMAGDDTGKRKARELSLGQASEKFETMREYLNILQEINDKIVKSTQEASGKAYSRVVLLIVLITGFALLAALSFWFLLTKAISVPVKEMVLRARDLAEGEGDLTRRITTANQDELGDLSGWFNRFIGQIHDIVNEVKSHSVSLIQSTAKVSSGSQNLATRTNEQAASITETSATLEEFASILKSNKENSDEVNHLLETFNEEVKDKRSLIENVTGTMQEITDSGKKIDMIVSVINDISFQTNLLALNAAVEAARAGDAGRGFAVVASEVRNLAQKTAESSRNIQEIVTDNIQTTEKGMKLVTETSEFFAGIADLLDNVASKMQVIANSSKEQFTGVEQINLAVSQLEEVINQNANLVDDFSNAAKDMLGNANDLKELMQRFKTVS